MSNIECGFIVLYAKNDGKISSAPGEFRMKYTTMREGVCIQVKFSAKYRKLEYYSFSMVSLL